MKGYNAVAHVNAEIRDGSTVPQNADRVVKSWAMTSEQAVEEKQKLQEEYEGVFEIRD